MLTIRSRMMVYRWCLVVLALDGNISHVMIMLIPLQVVRVGIGSLNSSIVNVVAMPYRADGWLKMDRSRIYPRNTISSLIPMLRSLSCLPATRLCSIKCIVNQRLTCGILSHLTAVVLVITMLAVNIFHLLFLRILARPSCLHNRLMAIVTTSRINVVYIHRGLPGARTLEYQTVTLPPPIPMRVINLLFQYHRGPPCTKPRPCHLSIQ